MNGWTPCVVFLGASCLIVLWHVLDWVGQYAHWSWMGVIF